VRGGPFTRGLDLVDAARMRRTDKEITDPAELRRILEGARVCRVAMVDDGKPYLVPLSFVLDGDDLVFHAATSGRKLDVLRRNPSVCFEVEEGVEVAVGPSPCGTTQRYRSVIGFGEAELAEDAAERVRLLALFGPRYGAPDVPMSGERIRSTVVFRVRMRELTGKRSPA
jgi:nitroimidazol reductase NimA-like FMN-containing flavoprotein (pyridoxamine 5'-phosphate oxidase superfamily)